MARTKRAAKVAARKTRQANRRAKYGGKSFLKRAITSVGGAAMAIATGNPMGALQSLTTSQKVEPTPAEQQQQAQEIIANNSTAATAPAPPQQVLPLNTQAAGAYTPTPTNTPSAPSGGGGAMQEETGVDDVAEVQPKKASRVGIGVEIDNAAGTAKKDNNKTIMYVVIGAALLLVLVFVFKNKK